MYTHHHAWLQFAALTLTLANSLNEPNKSGKYFYVFYTWFTFILIGHLTLLKVLKYTLAIALSTCSYCCWQWTLANEEGRSLSFVVISLNSNPIGGERVMCRGSKLPKANKTHLKKKKNWTFDSHVIRSCSLKPGKFVSQPASSKRFLRSFVLF